MSRKLSFLAVEGPSDQVVVRRALRLLGFKKFNGKLAELGQVWRNDELKPTYPTRSGSLYDRVPMPSILYTDTSSVAVYEGGGSNLIPHVRELFVARDLPEALAAFAVIADSDDNPPAVVAAKYRAAFVDLFPAFPTRPGEVVPGPPALGVFVFPDNAQQGVVEHVVMECGDHVYANHMARARGYVADFAAEDRARAKWGPFDERKAVIASVVSLLKPGRANGASMDDNLWLGDETKHLPMLAELLRFLRALVPAGPAVEPPGAT